MGTIDIADIKMLLLKLINENIKREDAADFAHKLRLMDDEGKLHINEAEKKVIWNAIGFIEGIDLKDSPVSYLHDVSDIIKYYDNLQNQ